MFDLTMCTNEECSKRKTCIRAIVDDDIIQDKIKRENIQVSYADFKCNENNYVYYIKRGVQR